MDEPRKPEKKKAIFDYEGWWFICPECGLPIDYRQSKCDVCGQEFDWDGVK